MEAARAIFDALIPILLIIAAGAWARKRGHMGEHADEPLMKLTVNFLFPCLIFHSMLGNPLMKDHFLVFGSAGFGFGMVVLGCFLSLGVGKLLGFRKGDGLRTFGLASGVQNYGYFTIPLVGTLFLGNGGDKTLGVLFTHNVGVELALWSVGIAILSGNLKSLTQAFRKGPVAAVLVSLGLIWTGLDAFVPKVILRATQVVGACAVPIGVFLVGMALAELWGKSPIKPKVVVGAVMVRNLMIPAIYFAILALVPLELDLKRVLLIQSAMPGAIFPVVIARFYGGQPDVAAQATIATTLASLLTLPAIILLGLKWFL